MQLNASKDQGTNALEIVVDHRFPNVVLEGAGAPVPKTSHRTALRQGHLPFPVDLDELLNDPPVAFQDCRQIVAREVTVVHPLGQGVNEHARTGGLKVVPLPVALIGDLIPESAAGVLVFDDSGTDLLQRRNNLRSRGMIGGEVIERVNQGHGIPPDGAAPEIGRAAAGLAGPGLGFAFIPAVIEQPRLRIVVVRCDQADLLGHIIERRGGLLE